MEGGTTFNVSESTATPEHDVLAERYELGELLGSGGMADVYAARDRLLDRDVAIKFFRPLDERAERARFVGEARMLAGLSHPGLVTVFDAYFEDGRRPYLVMRLVDGGTLRQLINTDGPLPSGRVARLGARLATALAHVHANGIVHRDVKPSNVLIDSAGDHYLADFGLAWALGSARLTNSGELVGTACYLAPEQVTGTAVGPQADIYALGLVLLECLTGRTEYDGTDVEAAVARLSRPPIVPHELGPAWQPLLIAMTDNHPTNRPDAVECARRLRAIARTASATADTTYRDPVHAELRRTTRGAVPAIAAAGPCTAEPRTARLVEPQPTGRPPARSQRVGKLRAGLGAAGATGVALTVLLFTPPAGTAGEPIPDSAPGQSTTVPTQGDYRVRNGQTPATARSAPTPTTTRTQAGTGTNSPKARKATPAEDIKPKQGDKAQDKARSGRQATKPGKAK